MTSPNMPSTGDSPAAGPLVRLSQVGKNYGSIHALSGIDLEVSGGEVTCVLGDNGAGKSTLIKTISGIWTPDAGQIFWEGREVHIRGLSASAISPAREAQAAHD